MIEKAQGKGSRRLLLRIAVAGALTAIPMAAVAAPAFAAPVPGVVQVDGQHNQGNDGWQKNRGHDERHEGRHHERHEGRYDRDGWGQNAWYGQGQHRPC